MFAAPNTGLVATDRVFSDDDPKDIDTSTPDSALHRNVDLVVLKADEEGYVKTHIVLPSTIWGIASNPIVDAGIANRFSIQVPALIKAALDRKQAGVIGKGQAVWTAVNVNERTSLTPFSNITPILTVVYRGRILRPTVRRYHHHPLYSRARSQRLLLWRERRVYLV